MKFFRFLYLNLFVFVLLGLGICIFLLPSDIFLLVLKYLCAFFCATGAIGIFAQWKGKTGIIPVLVKRNQKTIRPDTFKKLNATLCGQLVVSLALRDLRKTEMYSSLSEAEWKERKLKAMGKKSKALSKDRKRR
jgi:hypothetical protein